MADRVQRVMESMAPALDDLRQREIFSDDELRVIVKRRTEFEYLIHRRSVELVDFLRYIEYELRLETDRKRRRIEMGSKKKSSPSEYAGIRHIHSIFERATGRFKQDVGIWKRYYRFCERTGGKKQLARAFAKGLALHPHETSLWIQAANHEYRHNHNITAARVLLQRAIRMNAASQRLWREYFRLEWLYARTLRERKEMGIGHAASASGTATTTEFEEGEDFIGMGDGEVADADADAPAPAGIDILISGAIPSTVYRNACEAIPSDLSFRLSFAPIARALGGAPGSRQALQLLESCVAEFGDRSEAWSALALAHGEGEGEGSGSEHGRVGVYERGVDIMESIPAPMAERRKMWGEYVQYLADRGDGDECVSVCERSHKSGSAGVAVYCVWLKAVVAKIGSGSGVDWSAIESVAERGLARHPQSCTIWSDYIALTGKVVGLSGPGPGPMPSRSVDQLLEAATLALPTRTDVDGTGTGADADADADVDAESVTRLWQARIASLVDGGAADGDVAALYRTAIRRLRDWHIVREHMMLCFVDWTVGSVAGQSQAKAAKAVRSVCDDLLQWRPLSLAVLFRCIGIEEEWFEVEAGTGAGSSSGTSVADIGRLRRWFEIGVGEFGRVSTPLWRRFLAMEQRSGHGDGHAHVVYRRAVQSLDDSSEFVTGASL